MKRWPGHGVFAAFVTCMLLASGCVVARPVASRGQPINRACVDACSQLREDCVGAQVASTFLLIPAYLIAVTGALFLAGAGGGGCNSGGDFGSGLSCREAKAECLRGCPLEAGPPPALSASSSRRAVQR